MGTDGRVEREPVRHQRVRALITEPDADKVVETGALAVRGLAWSGVEPIARVEISVNGEAWRPARNSLASLPGTAGSDGADYASRPAWSHHRPRPRHRLGGPHAAGTGRMEPPRVRAITPFRRCPFARSSRPPVSPKGQPQFRRELAVHHAARASRRRAARRQTTGAEGVQARWHRHVRH